jgi:secreted protein with Ig-like and vWFA domain
MEQHLPTLQAAATNFVKRLKPNDLAQVIDFDSRVEIRQTFTSNQADLEAAIHQTVAGGSTSPHNSVYIALRELRRVRAVTEEDLRRQALIVFSDGEDTSSLVSFEEVLDLAKRFETAVQVSVASQRHHPDQRLLRADDAMTSFSRRHACVPHAVH